MFVTPAYAQTGAAGGSDMLISIVTGGGLVGKVTKVINDHELEIDLGGMKVTAVRATIAEVRVKGEPVANQNAKK